MRPPGDSSESWAGVVAKGPNSSPYPGRPPGAWLPPDAVAAARLLLGAELLSTLDGCETRGRIVETEAYAGLHDPASHAHESRGRTPRNDAMFGPAGTLYVYLSHGIHRCANVVVGSEGEPAAILIRALEPLVGIEVMAERRGRATDLCSGPGRLAQALGIDLEHNRHNLAHSPIRLLRGRSVAPDAIGSSGRIGISRAQDWPLRFFLRGHPAVRAPRW